MAILERFAPARGLGISRIDNDFTINGTMETFGALATQAATTSAQTTINNTWTHTYPDGRSVRCIIAIVYRAPGVKENSGRVQIEMKDMGTDPSFVTGGVSGRRMELNMKDGNALTWVVAHEFGHVLGLDDRYKETKDTAGNRKTTAVPGYGGNIMADNGGVFESKNVSDLGSENKAGWTEDDDRARTFINGHTIEELRAVPSLTKATALRAMLTGWISDDDVNASVRLMSSITWKAESDYIKKYVCTFRFTSSSQLKRIQAAIDKMP